MSDPVTVMVIAGAAAGAGLALAVAGLNPPRPALAEVLDSLSRPAQPLLSGRRRLDLALAAPLRRLGLPGDRTARDLAILDRDPAEYLAQQLITAVASSVLLAALPVAWGLGGQLPLWLALLGTAAGLRFTQARLRAGAETRREQIRETLSTLLDLMGGCLAGGAGLEQALDETMQDLSGWAAVRIRRELAAAAQTRGPHRVPAATALRDLGRQIGVDELAELATAIAQAADGAPVAQTLSVVAATMRARATAEMERQAHARSAQLAVPTALYGIGYFIALLYAVMAAISTGLTN